MFTQIHDTQHQATAITKEAGFIISADDINQTQTMVSDEELMAVNGGGGGSQSCGRLAFGVYAAGA